MNPSAPHPQENESRFRLLFERSPDCVMLFDVETGKFLDCNHAAMVMLRCGREWLMGKHPWEMAPPVQSCGTPSFTKAQRIIAGIPLEGSMRFEWDQGRPDGSHFPAEISVTAMRLGPREIWYCVVRDITEARRAAAEARELRESLENRVRERTAQLALANGRLQETERHLLQALAAERELNNLKTSFVSMVSHEFRTPLGVIMVAGEVLARYFDRLTAEQRAEHLTAITGSVQRMSRIMEDVLLLSRMEAGRMTADPEELNLRLLCLRVADEVRSSAGPGAAIEADLDSGVPALGMGDGNLVRHILINLLTNAVKYSAPGAPVELRLRREGANAVFTVSDRGIGIPEADQPRVFEIFHRGGNTGQISGTGLGLVIVKRCCELHRGTISLQSAEGCGSMFKVILPLFEPDGGGASAGLPVI